MTSLRADASTRGDAVAFLEGVPGLAARSHAWACASLLALCLLCFLPGLSSLQPMDRDEPRFAQASKQMLETGDFVDIRFQAEARHKKPVGIYWAQSATVAAAEATGLEHARTIIALYRIPSLLGAIAAVLLTYWAGLAFLPRRGAWLAAALFGACLMLAAEARLAKTDAVLTACAVAAMGALARTWLGRAERRPDMGIVLVFWLALAVGILVKGPMVPLFAGLAALVLSIRERSGAWLLGLRPLLGLGLVLVLVAPWFIAITWKSGGAFYEASVGEDMLAKVASGRDKHWAPPGSYALAFFATFWPGAAFAALAIPFAWANRRSDNVAFLLAWIVPAWLVFEAVPTKLPHYLLPVMSAVAILTVLALLSGAVTAKRPGARWVAALVVLIPVGVTAILLAAAWSFDRTIPVAGLPLLLASCAMAVLAWLLFTRDRPESAIGLAILASALLAPAVFGLTQPVLAALKVSPRLAAIRDGLACPDPRVASLGYREPSLVFLVGTNLVMLDSAAQAANFLKAGGCRLVFVESRFAADFASASDAVPAARVAGFNINSGRRVELSAYAVVP
jgi:4-amino-4-deoxy-L-arabinose transferase-like glycosyltransferase